MLRPLSSQPNLVDSLPRQLRLVTAAEDGDGV